MKEIRALTDRACGLQRRERADTIGVRTCRRHTRDGGARVVHTVFALFALGRCLDRLRACDERNPLDDDDGRGRGMRDKERRDRHQQPEEAQQEVAAYEHRAKRMHESRVPEGHVFQKGASHRPSRGPAEGTQDRALRARRIFRCSSASSANSEGWMHAAMISSDSTRRGPGRLKNAFPSET